MKSPVQIWDSTYQNLLYNTRGDTLGKQGYCEENIDINNPFEVKPENVEKMKALTERLKEENDKSDKAFLEKLVNDALNEIENNYK